MAADSAARKPKRVYSHGIRLAFALCVARADALAPARIRRSFHARWRERMVAAPRKTAPYGTVKYYRDRIAGWQQELALGRYRRGALAGQSHRPERIQRLRQWIKDDRDKLFEAFANRRAAAGDPRAVRRLNWIHYVRGRRSEAERLVQYAQAQQRNLERIEESLGVGAPRGQATPKRYAPRMLRGLEVHQHRGRQSLEETLAQIAALPSKAPILYREWSRLAALSPGERWLSDVSPEPWVPGGGRILFDGQRLSMQCLLIEDDADTARDISNGLKEAGFGVKWCRNGVDGLHLATSERWDVVILDRMLPGDVEGLSIIQAIRTLGKTTPVLILSALASLDERVRGLRGGGDDYLAKPFAFSELLARVQALMRRSGMKGDVSEPQIADLRLDLRRRRAERANKPIALKPREFRLLEYLVRHQGQVVTRTMLLEAVWDHHFDPQTNAIDVQISRLRQKIDKDFSPPLLHTVRGVGYMVGIDG